MRRLILITLALAGCSEPPVSAEWRNVCVNSFTTLLTMIPVSSGQTTTMIPIYDVQCIEYELQCVSGTDGTTECGEKPDAAVQP